jgi:hypothetical protein
VVLPDGAYYGQVDPGLAVPLVRGHLRGEVVATALRGVTTEPPVVQAAVVEALRRFGPAAIRDVRGAGLQPVGHDTWTVYLEGDGPMPPSLVATVVRARRPPARLTCRAVADSAADSFEVAELWAEHPGERSRQRSDERC